MYLSYLVWLLPGVGDGFMLRDNEPFGLDTLPIVFSWWWPPMSDPANDKWEFLRGFFLFFIRFMNCFFRLRSELLFFFAFFNSVSNENGKENCEFLLIWSLRAIGQYLLLHSSLTCCNVITITVTAIVFLWSHFFRFHLNVGSFSYTIVTFGRFLQGLDTLY